MEGSSIQIVGVLENNIVYINHFIQIDMYSLVIKSWLCKINGTDGQYEYDFENETHSGMCKAALKIVTALNAAVSF